MDFILDEDYAKLEAEIEVIKLYVESIDARIKMRQGQIELLQHMRSERAGMLDVLETQRHKILYMEGLETAEEAGIII